MTRHAVAFAVLLAAGLFGAAAPAQKKPPAPPPCVCPAPEEPPPPARESALADCRDARDNDGDGHVDCADQDCGIYAMCLPGQGPAAAPAAGPPGAAPAAPARAYDSMRQLKQDLRSGAVSGREFARWQLVIRLRRSAEMDAARADYHSGAITRAELAARLEAIRLKFEG